MGKSYPPLPSLIFILSLAIIIICTFAALIYIPSPPPHSYAMCPKYWSPLKTVQKRKKKQKKTKKKQGNKHFPPHSSCSYVMCTEYCDCLLVFYLFLHSDFVLVVTESIFTFRCESEEEAGSWRDVGDRGDNFFHPTKSSLFNPCQWQAAAIFKDKRSI